MEITIHLDISRRSLVFMSALLLVTGTVAGSVMVKDPGPLEVFTTLDMKGNPVTDVDWANSDDGAGSQLDADMLDGNDGSYYNKNSETECSSGETLTGDGTCSTTSGGQQNLEDVLTQGNEARSNSAIVDRFYVDDHGAGGTPAISLAVGDSDTGLNSDSNGRLEFWSENKEKMSLTGSSLDLYGASFNVNGNFIKDPGEMKDSNGNTMINFDDTNRDVEINDNTGFQLPVGADAY